MMETLNLLFKKLRYFCVTLLTVNKIIVYVTCDIYMVHFVCVELIQMKKERRNIIVKGTKIDRIVDIDS